MRLISVNGVVGARLQWAEKGVEVGGDGRGCFFQGASYPGVEVELCQECSSLLRLDILGQAEGT